MKIKLADGHSHLKEIQETATKRVEKIIDNVLNKLDFDEEFIYKEKIACVLHDTGAILGKENHAYRSYLFAKDYFINKDINIGAYTPL